MPRRVPYGFSSDYGGTAKAGPAGDCEVRGIEVVQSIQDLANSVTLVAGKRTIVRVYVDTPDGASAGTLTGEIAWRRGRAGAAYLPAMRPIPFKPENQPDLEDQRLDHLASLNFLLPPQATAEGALSLRVNRLYFLGGEEYRPVGADEAAVEFEAVPPLRVRVIGLRYTHSGSGQTFTPDSVHFEYLRSYLRRSYPVAGIEWSQQVVNAQFQAPFVPGSTIFAALTQMMAMRANEVSRAGGVDPRTHYYGLVSDEGDFLQGKSLFSKPIVPRPDTVAVGPAGVPGNVLVDDLDQVSYADWYGAHELGHSFGRAHPGFPPPPDPLEQQNEDLDFPYPDGRISGDEPRFLGFDVGDPDHGLEMKVLSGADCHDIMTYKDHQWPSAYTYEAILDRLRAEDLLFANQPRK